MMQDSKLIDLLKALSKKDLAQLGKYFQFHYRKTNNAVVLFNHLADFAPDFNAEDLDKELAYKQVFKSKSYNDNVMRRTTSKLLEMCEEFIALNQLQQNEKAKKLALMRFYNEQGLDKHFKSVYRTWEKEQQQAGQIDELYFFNQFLVEQEISNQIFRQQDRSVEPNLKSISKELDNFYLMHKLKVCCTSVNYQLLSNTKYELSLVSEVLAHIEHNKEQQAPIVMAYYYALFTLTHPEEEQHFVQFNQTLFDNFVQFHPEERKDLFTLLQNYCIKKINDGNRTYLSRLFQLYKDGLNTAILFDENSLSPLDFKNIVTLGVRLSEFEWTEHFIKKYTINLDVSIRASYQDYNLARLFFGKNEFEKVLELLSKVAHQELFMLLDTKVMQLKCYYELEEFEVMQSLLESFRILLLRRKSLGYHKSRYQNFIKYLNKLMRLNLFDKTEKEGLIEEVVAAPQLLEKDWFLKKLEG